MNVQDVIVKLKDKGIDSLILADSVGIQVDTFNQLDFTSIEVYDDARSAGFYALGLAQSSQKPVAVLVENDVVDNLYTSMTEAWFQKLPIVYVVTDAFSDYDYEIYKRCVCSFYDFRDKAIGVELALSVFGPTLIVCNNEEDEMPNNQISDIVKLLPPEINFYIPTNRYGAISRYVGRAIGYEGTLICIVPKLWLRRDLNIFNNRYSKDLLKIILIDDGSPDVFIDWLKSNEIVILRGKDKHAISNLIESSKSTVLIF